MLVGILFVFKYVCLGHKDQLYKRITASTVQESRTQIWNRNVQPRQNGPIKRLYSAQTAPLCAIKSNRKTSHCAGVILKRRVPRFFADRRFDRSGSNEAQINLRCLEIVNVLFPFVQGCTLVKLDRRFLKVSFYGHETACLINTAKTSSMLETGSLRRMELHAKNRLFPMPLSEVSM